LSLEGLIEGGNELKGSVGFTLLEGSLSYRSGTRRIEVDRFPSNL